MSILVRYAMQNGDLMAIVGSSTYTVPETNKQPERTIYNSTALSAQNPSIRILCGTW